jgi:acetate kinase
MSTTAVDEPLIGVINAGSSSLKFSVYEGDTRLLSGQVEGIGVRLAVRTIDRSGDSLTPPAFGSEVPSTPSEALTAILPWIRDQLGGRRLRHWATGLSRRTATLETGAGNP